MDDNFGDSNSTQTCAYFTKFVWKCIRNEWDDNHDITTTVRRVRIVFVKAFKPTLPHMHRDKKIGAITATKLHSFARNLVLYNYHNYASLFAISEMVVQLKKKKLN